MIKVIGELKYENNIYADDLNIGDTFVFIGEEQCIYQMCHAGAVCIATTGNGYMNNYVGNIYTEECEKYKSNPIKKIECELAIK